MTRLSEKSLARRSASFSIEYSGDSSVEKRMRFVVSGQPSAIPESAQRTERNLMRASRVERVVYEHLRRFRWIVGLVAWTVSPCALVAQENLPFPETPSASVAGRTFDIGMDLGSPVALDYHERAPFEFNGKIHKVQIKYVEPEERSIRGVPVD